MATIHKCDRCNKIIKDKNSVRIIISDTNGIIGKELFHKDYDLCPDCAINSTKSLAKVFPEILLKKNKNIF